MTLGKQMSQRGTKPRVTMEGLEVAGSRKSGVCVCACTCLGFSYPNRDIKNHSTRAVGLNHLHGPHQRMPHCTAFPSTTNTYWGTFYVPGPPLGLSFQGLLWGCPESREIKSNGASPNPGEPLASQSAHHPSSFARLDFITIFLFGSLRSNLYGVRGDAKHLYL